MKRVLIFLCLAAVAGFALTRFFRAERLRSRVQESLERALNRKVEINGRIDYKWLTGPGIEVQDVVIHEDSSLGLEPIAYVASLEATPRWLPLFAGRMEFSTLRLINPSLNLMRAASGETNLRPFLDGLFAVRDSGTELPEIEVRGGRINFKQGVTKSVLYLTSTDMDLRPTESNGFNISLGTEMARTDRAPAGYGSFSGQGRLVLSAAQEPELDLTLDLDRTALGDLLLLFSPRRLDLGGRISARARIAGPLSAMLLDGRVDLEGFQRWNIPGFRPGGITIFYRGVADAAGQLLKLDSIPGSQNAVPVNVRVRVNGQTLPARWGIVAAAEELPLAVLADFARATGFRPFEADSIPGSAAGAIGVSSGYPSPRGGFTFAGPGFEGEYRILPGEAKPQRLRIEADEVVSGDLRMRGLKIQASGKEADWGAALECRSLTGAKELRGVRAAMNVTVGPDGFTGRLTDFRAGEYAGTGELLPDNRFEITLAGGKKIGGRQWPPALIP